MAPPDPTPIRVNGKRLPAGLRRVTIGRDPESDVRYSDERVSRRHAVLEAGEDGWVLRDLGCRNGTFRDGVPVTEIPVDAGLRLRLGHPVEGALLELAPTDGAGGEEEPAEEQPAEEERRAGAAAARLGPVRSGREAENDIRIEADLRVSRYHAELRPARDGRYELVDLGSHNGTFVNAERIRSAELADGDLVGIGNQLYTFQHGVLEAVAAEEAGSLRVADLYVEVDGDKRILDGVSLSLAPSSLMAVVGPSGSGKSTLLNALTGFRPADGGSVHVGDRDLYESYEELRFQMGYVPQEDILHPQLTVRRALEYAAELRFPPDVEEDERRSRVDEVIAELGLSERADTRIDKLSGGQRKRVSVGLELLTKPLLLFLDEPTSGLDPGNERELMELPHELSRGRPDRDRGRALDAEPRPLRPRCLPGPAGRWRTSGRPGTPSSTSPTTSRSEATPSSSRCSTGRGTSTGRPPSRAMSAGSGTSERRVRRPSAPGTRGRSRLTPLTRGSGSSRCSRAGPSR